MKISKVTDYAALMKKFCKCNQSQVKIQPSFFVLNTNSIGPGQTLHKLAPWSRHPL